MFFIDLPASLTMLLLALFFLWLPAILGSTFATIHAISNNQKTLLGVVGLLVAMFVGPFLLSDNGENVLLGLIPTLALAGGTLLFAKYVLWNNLPSLSKHAESTAVRATGTLALTAASIYVSFLLFPIMF